MCFLYRQSISIVYESKFKYIYRYFIKIDRCFCGILQSLPLRKCGLKSFSHHLCFVRFSHFPCGSVDWNYNSLIAQHRWKSHFPCGSVDWNWRWGVRRTGTDRHFPCGSVDWNIMKLVQRQTLIRHFPCGSVDWNLGLTADITSGRCHFPCGSVDWNFQDRSLPQEPLWSLPLRKCGLKWWMQDKDRKELSHFPCGSVDWNCHTVGSGSDGVPALPLRKCGLKYVYVCPKAIQQMSLPLRKCGLK